MEIKPINDFLKSLRTALTNTSVYFPEHPLFIKSIDDLKIKVTKVLDLYGSLKIMIKPDALVIGELTLSKDHLYQELVDTFHLKKIKSIEIKSQVKAQEVVDFLKIISQSADTLAKDGGVSAKLAKAQITNIVVEKLDYTAVLEAEGIDADPWDYLLNSKASNAQYRSIEEFTANFDDIAAKVKLNDIIDDDKLREHLVRFLNYLKVSNPAKFRQGSKILLKKILSDNATQKGETSEKLSQLLDRMDDKELAELLLDEAINDKNFDSLSFDFFSRLVNNDRHEKIASFLKEKIQDKHLMQDNPQLRSRLKSLFSVSSSPYITEIYRSILESFSQDGILTEVEVDKALLNENYRYVLINLLDLKKRNEKNSDLVSSLKEVCSQAFAQKDWIYIKALIEVFENVDFTYGKQNNPFGDIEKSLSAFIEEAVISGEFPSNIRSYLLNLRQHVYDSKVYLDKIFSLEKPTVDLLVVFLTFFPAEAELIVKRLKTKKDDPKYLRLFIDTLKEANLPASLEIYKAIYSMGNNFIRIEAIRAVSKLPIKDDNFLLDILRTGDIFCKKEVLSSIQNNKLLRDRALEFLFKEGNWRHLKENIDLVVELKLFGAKPFLLKLSKKPFFWNNGRRKAAKSALAKLES